MHLGDQGKGILEWKEDSTENTQNINLLHIWLKVLIYPQKSISTKVFLNLGMISKVYIRVDNSKDN